MLLSFSIFSNESSLLETINSHIIIEDYETALKEAKNACEKYKSSLKLKLKYIECLALNDFEMDAIKEIKNVTDKDNQFYETLENLSWSILSKASDSLGYTTRLTALIGVHLTQDVRAVNILNKHLLDSNAIIRSVVLQLSSSYLDKPLRDTVKKLFNEEKIWLVKLEVIKAIGKMKIYEKVENLKDIIGSEKTTFEEKEMATASLVNLTENIDLKEIQILAKSSKAGLRKLACDLVIYFNVSDAMQLIIDLAKDPITDVRISALNAISLNFLNSIEEKNLKNILQKAAEDSNPCVAITAGYIAALKNFGFGESILKKHIYSNDLENARFAACVLSHLPDRCNNLKKQILSKHKDLYVKANLALGLIAERKLLKESTEVLFGFLNLEKDKIMWEEKKNPLFQVLFPSYIRHLDQIPRYPEAIDQMTRLHILSLLAIVDDKKACDGIKNFLKQKGWGITGFASATLLKEGDEDSLNIVKQLLNEEDQDVKVQAALVLALLGREESVITTLEEAYYKADYNMKVQILEAVGHIGSKKSIGFLVNILDEPYQNLRAVAASSIIRCINS